MAVNTSYNYYSSIYNSNTMRMSGMFSGMDTDSIVSALLAQQQSKVDKQFQAMSLLEYKKEAYESVNTFIKDFRSMFMSTSNPATNIQAASTFKSYTVTSSDTSGAVSFTAGTGATSGSHTIEVKQLATSASIRGAKFDEGLSTSGTIEQLGLSFDAADSVTFEINGEEFTFTKDTTIAQMMSQINSNKNANANISYSSLTGAFTISSKSTGEDSTLSLLNISGNMFSETGGFRIGEVNEGELKGQNAIVSIDGIEVERSSNNFSIDGISYTLNRVTGGEINYSVSQDVDKAIEAIKSFVEGYNALVDVINEKLYEKKYTSYKPLTEEQRSAMTETQIKQWDEKAKSGVLKNDSGLQNLLDNMRQAFYTKVDGGKSAADIGITTMAYRAGSYDSTTNTGSKDNGKIQIDEAKLRKALETDPDAVAEIFTKASTATGASTKFNESGIAQRLYNGLTNYMYTTQANSMNTIDLSIKNYQDSMDNLLNKMAKSEERLYAQYTAMETALSNMDAQKNWLTAQLGGG